MTVFLRYFIRRSYGWLEEEILQIMQSLESRGVIKAMEFNSFTRVHHGDTEIKVSLLVQKLTVKFLRRVR